MRTTPRHLALGAARSYDVMSQLGWRPGFPWARW